MNIREMQHSDCIGMLSSGRLARLACCKDNIPYIVPISFRYVENHILSFSRPGKKIDWMRENPRVCLEIEQLADKIQWKCLLVEGSFRELKNRDEREYAWSLLQRDNDWWEPGGIKPAAQHVKESLDPVYFKIEIDRMSGREAFKDWQIVPP